MNFLATQPLWISALILIVPTTLLAMAGPVIVRRYVRASSQLRTNNEVAGFKFATVGVLYAVLLGLCRYRRLGKIQPGRKRSGQGGRRSGNCFSSDTGIDPEHGGCHSQGNDGLPDLRDCK